MGLDLELLTRPAERGHWSTSYGGFNELRRRLAESAGMGNLDDYQGYGGTQPYPPDEPLVPLLNHSDCEGELWWWQIEGLADRLVAVSRDWPHDVPAPFASDRARVERLAELCRRCVNERGVIAFR